MTNEYRAAVPDGSFHHTTIRRILGLTLFFEWYGGAYIEVGDRLDHAVEAINVWDDDTDEPTVPRTVAGMNAAIDEWIADYGEVDLVSDVRENWRFA